MINRIKVISIIKIDDTKFDEENVGGIIVKTFDNRKISLGIFVEKVTDAELWLSVDQAKGLISALEQAVEDCGS